MSKLRLDVAPSGAIMLRQQPEFDLERALSWAVFRLSLKPPRRNRQADYWEGIMYPDPHNYFASPAQGSTLNAGQFGSAFAQHPCRGCASQHHAYDAQTPAHPQRSLRQRFAALLSRKPQ